MHESDSTSDASRRMADEAADMETMQRLQCGDNLALNELMERWQKPVLGFAFRYVGNREDAVDIAQETFVRVYEYRDRFAGTGKFSTWLFSIAANLCRNHARWLSRHPSVPLDAGEESCKEHKDSAPQPWENAERDDLAGAVREQVQALPHDLKTVVLLSVYDERPHAEIAEMLHCTAKAVETRLYRARQLLRTALAKWKLK